MTGSRRQRHKREGTFLELVRDSLENLRNEISDIKLAISSFSASHLHSGCLNEWGMYDGTTANDWGMWYPIDSASSAKPCDSVSHVPPLVSVARASAIDGTRYDKAHFLAFRHCVELQSPEKDNVGTQLMMSTRVENFAGESGEKHDPEAPGTASLHRKPVCEVSCVENRCQYLQSFWEPIDPWLFLDRGELGQVRATCMENNAMVDQFTPFGAFATDFRDGNDKSIEQDGDTARLEPEVLDASCESAGTSGPSTSAPSTSSQRLVDIGPIKMHALSMARADGLFDDIFTESDATGIYDKYFRQGVALDLNDVQGIEGYMQSFFDELKVERQRIYRKRLTSTPV